MNASRYLLLAAVAVGALPGAALAAPGNTENEPGTARAEMVDVGRLTWIADLRFGRFAQPTAAGTMTISPFGVVTATGQVAGTLSMPQAPTGRGPGHWLVDGTGYRRFNVNLPNTVTITRVGGGATMTVTNITSNTVNGSQTFPSNGLFNLYIGGRLNVAANQVPGNYRGSLIFSVIYQ